MVGAENIDAIAGQIASAGTVDAAVYVAVIEMAGAVIAALIGAGGVIIAALISVRGIGRVVDRKIDSYFFSYSDRKHSLDRIMRNAKKEITIVVIYGDKMLTEYLEDLRSYLRRGIDIDFLMLSPKYAILTDTGYYLKGPEDTCRCLANVMDMLKELKTVQGRDSGTLEIRVAETFLTASYIGIDLDLREDENGVWEDRALIQMMIYQFGIKTPDAPITYLSPRKNIKQFSNTVKSIRQIWEKGAPLDIDRYEQTLSRIQAADYDLSKIDGSCW